MHIHLGALHGLTIFASVLFFGFFWRILAGMNADNAVGQAMSFIY